MHIKPIIKQFIEYVSERVIQITDLTEEQFKVLSDFVNTEKHMDIGCLCCSHLNSKLNFCDAYAMPVDDEIIRESKDCPKWIDAIPF